MQPSTAIDVANYLLSFNALRYRVAGTDYGLLVTGGDSEEWGALRALGIWPGTSHLLTSEDGGWLYDEVVETGYYMAKSALREHKAGVWEGRGPAQPIGPGKYRWTGFLRSGGHSYLVALDTLQKLNKRGQVTLRTEKASYFVPEINLDTSIHRVFVRYAR
jgi:hypothetical protein